MSDCAGLIVDRKDALHRSDCSARMATDLIASFGLACGYSPERCSVFLCTHEKLGQVLRLYVTVDRFPQCIEDTPTPKAVPERSSTSLLLSS